MKINWSRDAVRDLVRLHDFVAGINPVTARRIIAALHQAASQLAASPRKGRRLDGFDDAEVRRLIVAQYELRYEILDNAIYVLRIWHTREDR
jgi:plasmid stabilization system protein ParE